MRYRDWSPTPFDSKGLNGENLDRDDWMVVPVMQTRDSNCLEQSNFDAALALLGGEQEGRVEVHRFGHWGPGWFEIILVHPDLEGAVESIAGRLEDYPVLDEDDWCERENEAKVEYWQQCSLRERLDWCRDCGVSVFAARRDDQVPDPIYDRIEV